MNVRLSLQLISFVILFSITSITLAGTFGITASGVAIGIEPQALHGAQLMLNYDPEIFRWRSFNIYFDGGYSHFWQTNTSDYRSLNVVSIAPVIRYVFRRRLFIRPFLELSVGFAYLDRTRIDSRNLGIHFSFQDRIGFGFLFGTRDQFLLGFHALHYSNANICSHNSGITMPLVLDVGYRFQ